MRQFLYTIIATLAFISLYSCHQTRNHKVTDPDAYSPIKIERIDLAITDLATSDNKLRDSLKPGIELYLSLLGMSTDSIDDAMLAIHDSPLTSTFGLDVRDGFQVTDRIESELGRVARILNDTLPAINIGIVYGIVSPYYQSIIVSDSTVLIALNHYMGSNYGAYASMPAAMRRLKTPDRIPIDVAEALIRVNYPFITTENTTLLERILYEGAVVTALTDLFPDYSPDEILGLTADTYSATLDALPGQWAKLSSSRALYEYDDKTVNQLFSRQPGQDFPTYLGPVIGKEIVASYIVNNPSSTLEMLLSPLFYQQAQNSLIKARFAPEARR